MLIVPKEVQMVQNTAQAFFQRTFGQLSGDVRVGQRTLNAFMAISSLGNIIVVTFTAARGTLHEFRSISSILWFPHLGHN